MADDAETPDIPEGWYHADGDPPGTQRYWDGSEWVGVPVTRTDSGLDHELATPGSRIGARLIDALIVAVPLVVLLFATVDIDTDSNNWADDVPTWFLVMATLASAAYEVFFVAVLGATPGKSAVGIRVVEQESGATPPSWETSGRRAWPVLIGLIPVVATFAGLAIAILSLVWIFNDAQRRSVYDRTGRTYVVNKT